LGRAAPIGSENDNEGQWMTADRHQTDVCGAIDAFERQADVAKRDSSRSRFADG